MELQSFNWAKFLYPAFGITFLLSGLLINILQFALYATLNRVNKHLFRKINYYLNYSLFSQTVFVLHQWAGVKVKFHMKKSDFDKYAGKENVLLIMNHTYELDWLVGWVWCDFCGVLGNCKTFAKKSVQYIPTLGFAWKLGGSIFLERVWDKDKIIVGSKLEELTSFRDVFWLLLAAEGTRFTEEKHKASQNFAKEHGLPELRHHLTPRTKGFTTSIPYLRKSIPAIYVINVGIRPSEIEPSFRNILLGKSFTAGLFVERVPMTEVPDGENEQAAWLHNLYKRKDEVLHSYLETGSWFELSQVEECQGFYLPKRIYPLLNTVFWCLTILIPLFYLLVKLIVSGSWMSCITVFTLLGSLVLFFNKILGETKISKASSYGIQSSGTAEIKN